MSPKKITYDHTPVLEESTPIDKVYEQSIKNLKRLPQTTQVPEEKLKSNLPNIFTVPQTAPLIWAQEKEIYQHYLVVTKADVGGIGGHVETADQVQAAGLEYILRHNRLQGRPIFKSIFTSHTGDDLAFTGIVDQQTIQHKEALDELLWDAFTESSKVALKQGNYGPGQDLKADAFTGNIHGSGPASVSLPLPVREDPNQASQTVLIAFADKTEPGTYNHLTTGAYLDPNYNTGLLLAESAMSRGYIFEITDVDTKAQAIEAGTSPSNQKQMDAMMDKIGKNQRTITLSGPENLYDIAALTMQSSRYVISKIYSKDEKGKENKLGLVVSAERLHNIKTSKGYTYGGKDDPVLVALCQGDWPAPGEITAPLARTPIVAGDCRGSHYLHLYPMPINNQTSYFSGPIISVITLSVNIHTGRIGAISDQLACGTPWDQYRLQAAERMEQFRSSHGFRQPATLPVEEQEYHSGFKNRMTRLSASFKTK
ncbi:hypothetical protein A2164_04000, partial [Candidatus Curtissbacteria bacterium RBG_13_35_7]